MQHGPNDVMCSEQSNIPWHPMRMNQPIGLLPDTYNCGLPRRLGCRDRFPRHQRRRKPLVTEPGMYDAHAVMHVGIAQPQWLDNDPSIPGACPTRNFTYRARVPSRVMPDSISASHEQSGLSTANLGGSADCPNMYLGILRHTSQI